MNNIQKSFKKRDGLRGNCFAEGGDIGSAIRTGYIRGPGGPKDDKIPAMLSNKEYVLPADTTAKIGKENLDELLEATHEPNTDRDGDGEVDEAGNGTRLLHGLRGGFFNGGMVVSAGDRDAFGTVPHGRVYDQFTPFVPHSDVVAPHDARDTPRYNPPVWHKFADGGSVPLPPPTVINRAAYIDAVTGGAAPVKPVVQPAAQPAVQPAMQPAAPPPPTGNFDPAFLAKNGLGADGRPLPKPSILDRAKSALGFADGGAVPNWATEAGKARLPGSAVNFPVPYQAPVMTAAPAVEAAAPVAARGGAYGAGRAVGSVLRSAGSGTFGVPGVLAGNAIAGAAESADTDTPNYMRRVGMDVKAAPGPIATGVDTVMRNAPFVGPAYSAAFPDKGSAQQMMREIPARAAGVVSDMGANALDLGTGVVNAGLKAAGSSKHLTPFKEILSANDTDPARNVGPYTTNANAGSPRAAGATVASTGVSAPFARTPAPGEPGGPLKAVDKRDAEGNLVHRTITGSSDRTEAERNYDAPEGLRMRSLNAAARARDNRYSDSPGMSAGMSAGYSALAERGQKRFDANLAQQKYAVDTQAESARRGQDMTYAGHQLQYQAAGADQRMKAEEHVTKQLGEMFRTKNEKGESVADHDKVADFVTHAKHTMAGEIKQLESVPKDNPAYAVAQAKANYLRTRGVTDLNDPHMSKYLTAYNLKQRAKESHGMLPGKGTFVDSMDLNSYVEGAKPTSGIFGQQRIRTANGTEIPASDLAYTDGPSNYILPDVGRIPTRQFDSAKGLR